MMKKGVVAVCALLLVMVVSSFAHLVKPVELEVDENGETIDRNIKVEVREDEDFEGYYLVSVIVEEGYIKSMRMQLYKESNLVLETEISITVEEDETYGFLYVTKEIFEGMKILLERKHADREDPEFLLDCSKITPLKEDEE